MKINWIEFKENRKQKSKPLILVIDNDSDNLFLARYVIESLGMSCLNCEDSTKALSLIYHHFPSLILLDIVMPNLNGMDIAYQIKQDKNIQKTPIIAVTGLTREEDKKLIYEVGFDDYICKPYLIEELETKIELALNKLTKNS